MEFIEDFETQSHIGKYAKDVLGKTASNGTRAVKLSLSGDESDQSAVIVITGVADDNGDITYYYTEGNSDSITIESSDIPSYVMRGFRVLEGWRNYVPYSTRNMYAYFYLETGKLRHKYHVMTLVQQYLWPVAGKRPNWIGIAVDAAILLILLSILSGVIHRMRVRRRKNLI